MSLEHLLLSWYPSQRVTTSVLQHMVAQSIRTDFCTSDRLGVGWVPRGKKMLYSGTDPESYFAEYTSVYEDHSPFKTTFVLEVANPSSPKRLLAKVGFRHDRAAWDILQGYLAHKKRSPL